MYAEEEGPETAPPLVLLHGGLGTGRYHWSKPLRALSERWRVHLPDLPGHGHTPLPEDGSFSLRVLVDAVEGYLDDVGPPVHVGAFSMGGLAAMALAAVRPELFASLILVGVSVRDHPGLQAWRKGFDPDRLEAEYPVWAKHLARLHAPQGGDDAWKLVCRRDAAGLEAAIDVDALAGLHAPVLLVRGDRDPAVEPGHYAELRAVLTEAEEMVVPAGRHDVQLTRHRLVAPALTDFLRRARDNRQ